MTFLILALLAFLTLLIRAANEEHVLVIGTPGSGKSVGAARAALDYHHRGAVIILDPHKDSLAQLVLTHAEGNVLYDKLSDLTHPLGYDFLKPSSDPDRPRRQMLNQLRIQTLVEIMTRRRGGDVSATPLLEEWLTSLLQLFVAQDPPKPLSILPYGLIPDSDEFRALLRDATAPELRHKFRALEAMKTPRALRAEVGSCARVVNAIFRSPAFLARCDGGFDLGRFIQNRGLLIVERGDEIDEDAMRTIMGGIVVLATEHCETRPVADPPVLMVLEECTNARTAGRYEARKAGETRKYAQTWMPMCQWPDFVGGDEAYFQNCGRKVAYRVADYALAHRLAMIAETGFPKTDESRAERIAKLTARIMNFQPGQRLVTDRSGSRFETVAMLENPWVDWPNLRKSKLEEKLCRIYSRPEYGRNDGPDSSTSPPATPSPGPKSPIFSPAQRWRHGRKKPPASS